MHKLTHYGSPEAGPKVCVGVTQCVGLGERLRIIHMQIGMQARNGGSEKKARADEGAVDWDYCKKGLKWEGTGAAIHSMQSG
mmetsp:Transcript_138372/g.240616  ORF Transcript_138372/g.240616 Transcript_138372/m.240616 type:complete len:82 (+) Transcript_138372:824-1069(+)